MDDRRHSLIGRVANTLVGLESLSEGKTAKIDPNKVHGGEGGDVQLLRDKSPLEYATSELESWCDRFESRIQSERRQVRGEMSKLEETYWFFEEWEGKDYRTVADRTGLSPDEVWRKRERHGVNPKDGRPVSESKAA